MRLLREPDREEANKLDGVTASVNYATEKASVTGPDDLDPQTLIAEVEKTGYTAALPARTKGTGDSSEDEGDSAEDREPAFSAPAPHRRRGPGGASDRDGDDPSLAVRLLGLCLPRPGRPRGGLGGLAVPQGRMDEPQARCGHDGHAHLGGHDRGADLVDRGPVLRHRRPARRHPLLRA